MIDSNLIQKKFGSRVGNLRKQAGFSQELFAYKCGFHRTYMVCSEWGSKNLTTVNIKKISLALNISTSDLFQSL